MQYRYTCDLSKQRVELHAPALGAPRQLFQLALGFVVVSVVCKFLLRRAVNGEVVAVDNVVARSGRRLPGAAVPLLVHIIQETR